MACVTTLSISSVPRYRHQQTRATPHCSACCCSLLRVTGVGNASFIRHRVRAGHYSAKSLLTVAQITEDDDNKLFTAALNNPRPHTIG